MYSFMCCNVSSVKPPAVGQQLLSRAPYDRGSPGVDMVNDAFKRALVSWWSHLRKSFNVLQLEIRDRLCAVWVAFTEGWMGGVQGVWLTLKCHFLILLGEWLWKCAIYVPLDTTICQNFACIQLEHFEMWVIFNLGSSFKGKSAHWKWLLGIHSVAWNTTWSEKKKYITDLRH